MATIDKVRVLVVGDSGVGKTSLVHLICHNEPIGNPSWTIGCSTDVKLHDYKVGTPHEKTYFIELWDVGGWAAHQNARSIFFNPVHGIILVYDLTNRKSQQNLHKWLAEILMKDGKDTNNDYSYDPEYFSDSHVPILVVGSKVDQCSSKDVLPTMKATSSIADECGADQFNINCTEAKHLAPGTSNAVTISRFFDKTIERRFYNKESVQSTYQSSTPAFSYSSDRRRPPSTSFTKSLHID